MPCMRLEAQLFKQGDRADVICIDICGEAGDSQCVGVGEQQSQRFRHEPSAPIGCIEQATHLAAVARLAETVQATGADHLVTLPLDNRPLQRLPRLLQPHHARHHLRHHGGRGKAGIRGKLHEQRIAINLEQIGSILRVMVRSTIRVPVKFCFINLPERIRQTLIGCDCKWSQTPTGGRRCQVITRSVHAIVRLRTILHLLKPS